MSEIESIRRKDLDIELAWLAGFIDGEGNINMGFYRNGQNEFRVFRIEVVITNTHVSPIEKASELLNELGIFFKIDVRDGNHSKNPQWKRCLALRVQGQKNSIKLIRLILPYLTCKRELASQAIYAYEHRERLTRAGNNQYKQDLPRVQDDPILLAMVNRAKELVHFRPDPMKYSRKASEPMRIQKSSTTLRLTALTSEMIKSALHGDMQLT